MKITPGVSIVFEKSGCCVAYLNTQKLVVCLLDRRDYRLSNKGIPLAPVFQREVFIAENLELSNRGEQRALEA